MAACRRSSCSGAFVALTGLALLLVAVRPAVCKLHQRVPRDANSKRKLDVVTILTAPYTMKTSDKDALYGGFEGFVPDLLRELELRLNLDITLYLSPDGKYGAKVDNDSWSGMIGEVIKKEKTNTGADMAAAPITITSGRERVVNFLKAFQHHGLTLVVKKPVVNPSRDIWEYTFDIVQPLSGEVWALCSLGVIVVGLLLWANNRFNPYEWGGRHNMGRATEAASESFNLQGSLWFAFTSLQWQGFERAPRSISSKTLTCFWFVFVTITLVTYTGSLVNYLFWASTVHGKDPTRSEIQSLRDLVRRQDYDYGYIQGGATGNYFMNVAKGPIYDKMRTYWATQRGRQAIVRSNNEGFQRVRDSTETRKYAFVCEKYFAEYLVQRRPCDLMTTGELIGRRSFGFPVRENLDHQLSEDLHAAILEMMEEGDIEALEKKWWNVAGECWNETIADRRLSQQSALYINKPKVVTINMFWGPVVLLVVGIALTILVAIAEILYYKYKGRYQRQNRPGDAKLDLDDDA